MSSDSDSNTGPAATNELPVEMSTPTSPTDTRHPLARVESISQQNDGLSESFQSTDTVRRRPEPISYGKQTMRLSQIGERFDFIYLYIQELTSL